MKRIEIFLKDKLEYIKNEDLLCIFDSLSDIADSIIYNDEEIPKEFIVNKLDDINFIINQLKEKYKDESK